MLSLKTEKGPKAPRAERELFTMLPVSPILPAPGLCPKLANLFLLPYSFLRCCPLLLLLTIIVNINDQAYQDHGTDCHSPHIDTIGNDIPHRKCHCHAK